MLLLKMVSNSYLSILQWTREIGCKWNDDSCKYAAPKELQWARENGCPWTEETCQLLLRMAISPVANEQKRIAVPKGHFTCLQWARENGCDWDSDTCDVAAEGGHLLCLQWARENMCEWNSSTCCAAAGSGQISTLQWARENGCPWNVDTLVAAAEGEHLSCLQWARENGCPEEWIWQLQVSTFVIFVSLGLWCTLIKSLHDHQISSIIHCNRLHHLSATSHIYITLIIVTFFQSIATRVHDLSSVSGLTFVLAPFFFICLNLHYCLFLHVIHSLVLPFFSYFFYRHPT